MFIRRRRRGASSKVRSPVNLVVTGVADVRSPVDLVTGVADRHLVLQ